MSPTPLTVCCGGRPAGTLFAHGRSLNFEYERDWVDDGLPPLSQSLPTDGRFTELEVGAWFAGLLPEGVPRQVLARRLGVSSGNTFGLLAEIGGDTAGAISLLPAGERCPQETGGDIDWLDDDDLVQVIDELPTRPMHVDATGEWRLSLAGAQDKLPVVFDGTRVGLTRGRTPSTHILKTAIDRLPDTVANEAYCLALAARTGIAAAHALPRRVQRREFLLVERYDRTGGNPVRRLHQEDFCQATSIPPEQKYEAEGGPGTTDCFSLLRQSATTPAREIPGLLDLIGLNFLIGNNDAHGKNFSLLYDTEPARTRLAPAYDLRSTVAYHRKFDLSRKMAMKIGGEARPDYVQRRHLEQMLDDAALAKAGGRRRLAALADATERHAAALRDEFDADGWGSPVIDEIVALIGRRSELLRAATGS